MTETMEGTDAQNAAAVLSEIAVNGQEKPAVDREDSVAISDLETAIEGVMNKIKWHEQQIGNLGDQIGNHKQQIESLRDSLRKIVGPVLGQSLTPRAAEDQSTGRLIIECLKKSKSALDTKAIKTYLEERGNETQPSVELSRMVKRGTLIRSGRGLYRLK